MYPYQLNLDDLLDAAISILPSDAYALCMMVDDDLYEDEEDTFVCGRAYGGSRVAVVSSARYNPVLDAAQSVEREHAWPASHCKSYLEASCTKAGSTRKRRKVSSFSSSSSSSSSSSESNHHHHHHKSAPLEAALAAFSSSHETDTPMHLNASPALLSKLWLARICRTKSFAIFIISPLASSRRH
ncbi:hypothetical protein ARAM_004674 [Aspergillus rambellii]|uniref:Uncharacterized protein n=1 Tax=Aspergillus rambellii TaxID=308745 RepID=A0A0F8VDP9_9EURO|nr:hypothetical protein ARAM_004674 [Aspergillus rambellii]